MPNELSESPPSFDLPFPREILSKEKVFIVFQKIFEVMRWELYLKIKEVVKDRPSDEHSYYITKNEMKSIMNALDLWKIREEVFDLYSIPVPKPEIDPPHEILMRAHYSYIYDSEFDQNIRKLK